MLTHVNNLLAHVLVVKPPHKILGNVSNAINMICIWRLPCTILTHCAFDGLMAVRHQGNSRIWCDESSEITLDIDNSEVMFLSEKKGAQECLYSSCKKKYEEIL